MTESHKDIWLRLTKEAMLAIRGPAEWHWFKYHFSILPLHPFARSIVDACIDCEQKIPGLGSQFINDLASIRGQQNHRPHYDQLMQKLAELLVLRQLLNLDWPAGSTFEHEPAARANGKRPELRVCTPNHNYLFEVKTPSLLEHVENRNRNPVQLPSRALPRNHLAAVAAGRELTLPRDNPVKDFLIDADKKFGQFKVVATHTSILIIVWDDHIYEPITVLTHKQCGLLTPNSYFKDDNNAAIQFSHIDAVVLVRHLNNFKQAAANTPLLDRTHAMDFGQPTDLPNVFIPVTATTAVPDLIRSGLRALPLDAPECRAAAEYHAQDVIFWM